MAAGRTGPNTVLGGEAVVISPDENTVRMLNDAGSRIWELADGTRTLDEIAAALAAEFEVDQTHARASTAAFVNELVGKDLLGWA